MANDDQGGSSGKPPPTSGGSGKNTEPEKNASGGFRGKSQLPPTFRRTPHASWRDLPGSKNNQIDFDAQNNNQATTIKTTACLDVMSTCDAVPGPPF